MSNISDANFIKDINLLMQPVRSVDIIKEGHVVRGPFDGLIDDWYDVMVIIPDNIDGLHDVEFPTANNILQRMVKLATMCGKLSDAKEMMHYAIKLVVSVDYLADNYDNVYIQVQEPSGYPMATNTAGMITEDE